MRLGQYAQQWGESLFFGDNAVARAQGAIDIFKLLQSPNAQFKEILRPTPQIGAQLQVTPAITVGAYYQFRWIEDRLPPAGSYFSNANVPWGSTLPEFVSIPPPAPIAGHYVLQPGSDAEAKNSGQFGLQLKWRLDETDLGLYYAPVPRQGRPALRQPERRQPARASSWYYVFPEDIKALGASATHTFGDFNVALEGSVRDNMPLRSTNMLYPGAFAPAPQYATGRTAHVNLSTLATFGPELHRARIDPGRRDRLEPRAAASTIRTTNSTRGRTRDAAALQLIFTPTYRQALPGLDLGVPVGVRYSLAGCSSVTVWDCKGNGYFTLGLEGNVLNTWQFALGYQHFFGSADPFVDYSPILTGGSPIYGQGNSLRDRDFITLSRALHVLNIRGDTHHEPHTHRCCACSPLACMAALPALAGRLRRRGRQAEDRAHAAGRREGRQQGRHHSRLDRRLHDADPRRQARRPPRRPVHGREAAVQHRREERRRSTPTS